MMGDFLVFVVWIAFVGVIVAHGAFAYGVAIDSQLLLDDGRELQLVPRWAWCLATALLGPLMGVLYWLVHRSRLAQVDAVGRAEPRAPCTRDDA